VPFTSVGSEALDRSRLTLWFTVHRVPFMKGVVSVAHGRLRGVWRGDLWSFSGIPYAKAPVGELRWRPPLAPDAWDEIREFERAILDFDAAIRLDGAASR